MSPTVDQPQQVKFVITTQCERGGQIKNYVQESAVRSFLTSRQHARRRSQVHHEFVPQVVRTRKERTKSLLNHNEVHYSAQKHLRRSGDIAESDRKNDATEGGLSFNDLLDIFGGSSDEPQSTSGSLSEVLQDHAEGKNTGVQCHAEYLDNAMTVLDEKTAQAMDPVIVMLQAKGASSSTLLSNPDRMSVHENYFESLSMEINTVLDPFVRLPLELTKEEESLIHFCQCLLHPFCQH